MSYLIDSDLISLAHKKYLPPALEKWLAQYESETFISEITIAEMRFGVERAPESHREILAAQVAATEKNFAAAIERVNLETLLQWKRVLAFLKKERRTVSCEDTLLAAQCLAAGHMIATNNLKDFQLFAPLGLQMVNPLL